MNRPRKPWVAVILTFVSIGLGHIYNGEAIKGILLFFAGYLVFAFLFFLWLIFPHAGPYMAAVIGMLFVLYCLSDAYQTAKRKKDQFTLKKYNRWYLYLLFGLVSGVVGNFTSYFGWLVELFLRT